MDGGREDGGGGGSGSDGSKGTDTGGIINLLAFKVGKEALGSEKLDFVSLLASSSTSKMGRLRRLRRSQRPSRTKNRMIKRQPIKETIPTSTDCGVVSADGAAVVDSVAVTMLVADGDEEASGDCDVAVGSSGVAVEDEVTDGEIVTVEVDWVFGDWDWDCADVLVIASFVVDVIDSELVVIAAAVVVVDEFVSTSGGV